MYITSAVEQMEFSPNILHMFLTSNWCRAIVNVFVGYFSLIICGAWVDTPDTLLDLPESPVFLSVLHLERERERGHTLCAVSTSPYVQLAMAGLELIKGDKIRFIRCVCYCLGTCLFIRP